MREIKIGCVGCLVVVLSLMHGQTCGNDYQALLIAKANHMKVRLTVAVNDKQNLLFINKLEVQ